MDWLALVPSALSAISSLTAKKNKPPQYQAPQYQSPGAYQAPGVPNLQAQLGGVGSQIPEYAKMFAESAPVYDVSQGAPYQQMLAQFQSGKLPAEYRNAVLGQAQQEAGAAYDQASTRLGRDRDRASRSAAEQMNKLGLLSSGAHGIRQGYLDESYGEQLGGLATQYQGQLGRASLGLMDQELSQRDRMAQLLAGIEQQRVQSSLASRQGLLSAVGQERSLQAGLLGQQATMAQRGAEFGYNAAQQNAQNMFNAQQQNAQQQFASQKFGYEQAGAANSAMMQNFGSLVSEYGRQRSIRRKVR